MKFQSEGKSKGKKHDTNILNVYIPAEFAKVALFLMDCQIQDKDVDKSLIPFELFKEDPSLFGRWMHQYAVFLNGHCNIQIKNVCHNNFDESPTLKPRLETHPVIHRICFNSCNNQLQVLTTASNFGIIGEWIDGLLTEYPFNPARIIQKINPSCSGKRLRTGKYLEAFTLMGDDNFLDLSTIKTNYFDLDWIIVPSDHSNCNNSTKEGLLILAPMTTNKNYPDDDTIQTKIDEIV